MPKTTRADSLKAIIPSLNEETAKVDVVDRIYRQVFFELIRIQQLFMQNQAKELAEQIDYQKGLGYALKNIGLAYYVKSDLC